MEACEQKKSSLKENANWRFKQGSFELSLLHIVIRLSGVQSRCHSQMPAHLISRLDSSQWGLCL